MKLRASFTPAVALFLTSSGLVLGAASQPSTNTPDSPTEHRPSAPSSRATPAASPANATSDAASPSGGASSGSTAAGDDFARMDTDRDGRVSAVEYASSEVATLDAVAAGERRGTKNFRRGSNLPNHEDRAPKAFQRLDKNHDGYLTREEWAAGRGGDANATKR
jgi:hypothetical protein